MKSKKSKNKICKICIVKRKGQSEEFDEKKVYASVYSAAMANGLGEKQSEKLANKITKLIKKWVDKKKSIDSKDIFKQVVSLLKKEDKDAAFLYETHRDIS